MNSIELIAWLRRQAESIPITDEVRPGNVNLPIEYAAGLLENFSDCLRRYNYEAYLEITNPETIVVLADVDNAAMTTFEAILEAYMDAYAPNRPNLKKYIKLVSLYLAFVARRPLHPPRVRAPDSDKGVTTEGRTYCVMGKGSLDERFPICRYCVAHSK
jgi:uncharacterized protein (UPF0305 family)